MQEDIVPEHLITNKIYLIRNQKVMVDSDLSELYGIETKALNQQVKRNLERFPDDFMFQLTKEEFENLKSQIVTSRWGGRRTMPYVFTEHGVLMLSSVLSSKRAIAVNINIMRVYTKIKDLLSTHKDILLKMEELEKKVTGQDERIEIVFDYLRQFVNDKESPRVKIGYNRKD